MGKHFVTREVIKIQEKSRTKIHRKDKYRANTSSKNIKKKLRFNILQDSVISGLQLRSVLS